MKKINHQRHGLKAGLSLGLELPLVTKSGIHASLHCECHHQVLFVKIDLKVDYPPLYEFLIWNYKNVDFPSINHTVVSFEWGNLFNCKNVYKNIFACLSSVNKIISLSGHEQVCLMTCLDFMTSMSRLNHEQVHIFSKTTLNTFKFSSKETIICDNKDKLQFNKGIRHMLNKLYKLNI